MKIITINNRKEQRLFFLGALILIFFSSNLFAAFSAKSAGTSGAAFLKIGAGARPQALGEAYTAVADDANAIHTNAAGLATLKKNEFVAMRAQLFQDLQYHFFAYAHPTKSYGTFAFALNNLLISDIERRTADTDNPDSTFSSNDSAYTLAYAKKWDDSLSFGGGFKYIRQVLADDAANSYGLDLGSLYQFSELPLAIGFSVQNLGSKVKFKDESDSLPLTIKLGTSYRLGKNWKISGQNGEGIEKKGLLLSMDGNFPRDNDPSLRLGSEFTKTWLREDLSTSIRAGYQTGRNRQIEGTGIGVSAGTGITYKFFSFDFAWMPFGNLGNTFRYSVRLEF
ncbi:MAG: hypothetical protein A3I11_04015 [Elusimicrobia bacterium RIFCSPLOWO2_02_FULL_39_32]|nr:MAG: hypothetical protein A3B80_02590 [Elusimicrobia bacterium RIFCSPHIGHO2_02_FULL_39_36]OGR92869.1 MAG: hypothetical protein A3I11_04015 [Elusimicrobia bacterium RIFCSPLOWO2_02_FULL_39_32]OGR99653.1 MAG: hypothetical protein A3G85_01380 [Elusimicrobia bacterium RIFCSPLOWO2_12_FULL_39_28]